MNSAKKMAAIPQPENVTGRNVHRENTSAGTMKSRYLMMSMNIIVSADIGKYIKPAKVSATRRLTDVMICAMNWMTEHGRQQ